MKPSQLAQGLERKNTSGSGETSAEGEEESGKEQRSLSRQGFKDPSFIGFFVLKIPRVFSTMKREGIEYREVLREKERGEKKG